MTARADATLATAERIVEAAIEVFWERPSQNVSLEEIASRSGTTKQTILRRFGSKAGLLAAAAERDLERIGAERGNVVPGDTAGAIRLLVAHYERIGDAVLRLLAEATREPGLHEIADRGRDYHAAWCERAFSPALGRLRGIERERRLGQLIAVTDVYTWKLLRRDRRLSRRQTEIALRELAEALAGGRR